jgi:DNA-binding response OmpR family regulator
MDNRDTPATVLVADDDNAVRQFVRTAIEQIWLNVCEASNGSEVLEQFTLRHPDVIVLDVMMPVMDGFTACSKVRGEPRGAQIPILMMTGLDDAEAIARAYEHGATDFIAKPLNPTMLSQRIRYLLRGSQTVRNCAG